MLQLRESGLTWNVVGGNVVVLDLDGSVYLRLNESAGTLWQELTGPRTIRDLTCILVDRYGLSEEAALIDVEDFVEDLRRRNLVDDPATAER